MKFRKNARNGTRIIGVILAIISILLVAIKVIPNVDYNTLNMRDKMMYDMGVYEGKTPIWKNVCWIIIYFLIALELIVYLIMCRCNYCGKYVGYISKKERYCSYCLKKLDKTEEDILKEKNEKSDNDI